MSTEELLAALSELNPDILRGFVLARLQLMDDSDRVIASDCEVVGDLIAAKDKQALSVMSSKHDKLVRDIILHNDFAIHALVEHSMRYRGSNLGGLYSSLTKLAEHVRDRIEEHNSKPKR